jgi:hypothetical protein
MWGPPVSPTVWTTAPRPHARCQNVATAATAIFHPWDPLLRSPASTASRGDKRRARAEWSSSLFLPLHRTASALLPITTYSSSLSHHGPPLCGKPDSVLLRPHLRHGREHHHLRQFTVSRSNSPARCHALVEEGELPCSGSWVERPNWSGNPS